MKKLLSFAALCFCLTVASAFAKEGEKAEYQNILSGSTAGGYFATWTDGTGGGASNTLAVSVSYTRDLAHCVGGSVEASYISTSASDHSLELLVGPEFSFNAEDPANAPFVTALIGLQNDATSGTLSSGTTSSTNFVMRGIVGKRIELFSHVSYTPEILLTRVTKTSTTLSFVPVSFSFLF